jgi:hypothetical protein
VDLYVDILIAAFPYMEKEEARSLCETLNEQLITELSRGNGQAMLEYDGYRLMMMAGENEQVAVGLISSYDMAALQEWIATPKN